MKIKMKAIKRNKIVLAYSGGLDTSFCIPYLIDQGFDVLAVSINTGKFSTKYLQEIKKRALKLGASHYETIDISEEYYSKCIRFMIYGNILRGDTYPLSVSSERAFQALAILKYIKKVRAKYVAHGSTGAGNDQIRFDLIFQSLAPKIKIVTPIRDNNFSRKDEVDYLANKGLNWPKQKKDYSINEGLWGSSVGGKETLTSHLTLPSEVYPSQIKKSKPTTLRIEFRKGSFYALNSKKDKPIELIKKLEKLASAYAIGRDVHVGDTIIGIKGRVGFEAAAAMIIIKAHQLLEKHTLSKWQQHWKKQLADWYGMQLHEGQYLDPSMRDIEIFLENSQRYVNGSVSVELKPYHFSLNGVNSNNDLMDSKFGAYGEENKTWSGNDARGFTTILSNPHKIFFDVNKEEKI